MPATASARPLAEANAWETKAVEPAVAPAPQGSFHAPGHSGGAGGVGEHLSGAKTAADAQERLGHGVVLRWKNLAAEAPAAAPTTGSSDSGARGVSGGHGSPSVFQTSASVGIEDVFANPLRDSRTHRGAAPVRWAAYQDPGASSGREVGSPPVPSRTDEAPANVPQIELPELPDSGTAESGPQDAPQDATDPLMIPEPAPRPQSVPVDPPPRTIVPESEPVNPFPAAPSRNQESPSDLQFQNPSREGVQRTLISCDDLRERVKQHTIFDVTLDVSPRYGEGLRTVHRDTEGERLDFAAQSIVRTWRNAAGEIIAEGRLIDLRDDHVVLDVNGRQRRVPLWELSDADAAYVGESWHIPLRCGRGYDEYAGRAFVPSAVQWKAPNHSHKPLYFEQPHLERYGHTLGPVLQPLVSTAHFFTTIGLLPYKMGIHPPYECQYPLGYYRPGDCVPQSIRPVPWRRREWCSAAGRLFRSRFPHEPPAESGRTAGWFVDDLATRRSAVRRTRPVG